jgi:3-keto-5-aminohexanoate cleavage enzyme
LSTPAIITVAITGAVPTKEDNPAVPVTPEEQVESTHAAFEAGAAVCHIHVRDSQERPSSDPELFARVAEGLAKHCPEMVVQFSTGARGRAQSERGRALQLRPDMASLATGSVNFPDSIYENPPSLVEELARTMRELEIKPEIEVFDMAMLYTAADQIRRDVLEMPVHVQLVMGIKNALPARESLVEFFAAELTDVLPGATWSAMATGRWQLQANHWSLARGGHVRTGLEDNVYYEKDQLAESNAQLVARVAELCERYERHPASPAEARALLGLQPVGPEPRTSADKASSHRAASTL